MKKIFLLIALVITSSVYPEIQAKTNKEVMKNGEQIFIEHADEC